MANIYEGMNVRQKLAKARLQFLNQKVKKSGKNMHLEFKYFELEDIVPPAIRIFARVGLTTDIDFTKDFCLCNALKYIYRHRRKNGLEDIQKAIWYLNKAVELDGQIKELIDCRTIGESEPRYMEDRSNEEI